MGNSGPSGVKSGFGSTCSQSTPSANGDIFGQNVTWTSTGTGHQGQWRSQFRPPTPGFDPSVIFSDESEDDSDQEEGATSGFGYIFGESTPSANDGIFDQNNAWTGLGTENLGRQQRSAFRTQSAASGATSGFGSNFGQSRPSTNGGILDQNDAWTSIGTENLGRQRRSTLRTQSPASGSTSSFGYTGGQSTHSAQDGLFCQNVAGTSTGLRPFGGNQGSPVGTQQSGHDFTATPGNSRGIIFVQKSTTSTGPPARTGFNTFEMSLFNNSENGNFSIN